jgi:hypothetical protein
MKIFIHKLLFMSLSKLQQILANHSVDAFEFIPCMPGDKSTFYPFLLQDNNLAIPLPLLLSLLIEIKSDIHLQNNNNWNSQISLMLNPEDYSALGTRKRGKYFMSDKSRSKRSNSSFRW